MRKAVVSSPVVSAADPTIIPDKQNKFRIRGIYGVSWSTIREAFSKFIGLDDDDDSNRDNDDAPQPSINPEDHGVKIPALFEQFVNTLNMG